jgi:hypothetical protein
MKYYNNVVYINLKLIIMKKWSVAILWYYDIII